MTIEYDVTEQDYLNFNLYHAGHSRYSKNQTFMLRYGAALLMLLAFFVLYRGSMLAVAIGIVFVIMWIVLFPKYYEGLIKRSVKKMISEGKNNDFIGHQRLTLKDDCIEEATRDSTSATKYSAVEKLCYGYDCIYVYIGALKAFIIPVTAFTDEAQRNEFINTLKEKIGPEMQIEGEIK